MSSENFQKIILHMEMTIKQEESKERICRKNIS